MSMASGFIKNDQPLREKLSYEETLGYIQPRPKKNTAQNAEQNPR
jgi:hypothetical protein